MNASKKYLTDAAVHQALLLVDLTEKSAPEHAVRLLLNEILQRLAESGWPQAQLQTGPRVVSAEENYVGDSLICLCRPSSASGCCRGRRMCCSGWCFEIVRDRSRRLRRTPCTRISSARCTRAPPGRGTRWMFRMFDAE